MKKILSNIYFAFHKGESNNSKIKMFMHEKKNAPNNRSV